MTDKNKQAPLSFKLAGWYGMIFASCFLLYGGIKIILSILDRNYSDLGNPIIFSIFGLILISFAIAFRDLRKWGWYGMIVINSLVVVGALVMYQYYADIILVILSGITLYFLFSPSTRTYLAGKH
jgi:hypothetical protein